MTVRALCLTSDPCVELPPLGQTSLFSFFPYTLLHPCLYRSSLFLCSLQLSLCMQQTHEQCRTPVFYWIYLQLERRGETGASRQRSFGRKRATFRVNKSNRPKKTTMYIYIIYIWVIIFFLLYLFGSLCTFPFPPQIYVYIFIFVFIGVFFLRAP